MNRLENKAQNESRNNEVAQTMALTSKDDIGKPTQSIRYQGKSVDSQKGSSEISSS